MRTAEYQSQAGPRAKDVAHLIELAAANGRLVHIEKDLFLHCESEQRMRKLLSEQLSSGSGMTLSSIRELLGTTRKYAVPYCEYLDRVGFTRRKGDLRVLAEPSGSSR